MSVKKERRQRRALERLEALPKLVEITDFDGKRTTLERTEHNKRELAEIAILRSKLGIREERGE